MRRTPWAGIGWFTVSALATVVFLVFPGPHVIAQNHAPNSTPEDVVAASPSYAFDFSDDRVLVGVAEYVFLGEVLEQVGTRGIPTSDPETEIPQTQYRVQVLHVIKGELPEEVVVSQGNWTVKGTGELTFIAGDPLLEPKEFVLFAVNSEPGFDWYTVVAGPFGAIRAKDMTDTDSLVARFTEAEGAQFVPLPVSVVVAEDDTGQADAGRSERGKKWRSQETS